ncbi:MAG: hypothetical protein COZ12_07090 [Deltaproteobacteria bacterium CG_4_10_14_3_um_filter_60_8]|nr:MAG: hypothetical protein COX17_07315 [Deltaproteobacteria bacterium CG23_combo_of_CG06-09_8_20_14_all_60_8]PIY21001.1 MAG: hypothetical protein COZ12_07090 [Deltaproteobacteria bacterium CG_4_10_14_3_um_filter_60_8]
MLSFVRLRRDQATTVGPAQMAKAGGQDLMHDAVAELGGEKGSIRVPVCDIFVYQLEMGDQ